MKSTLLGAALAFALFFAPQAALAQSCPVTTLAEAKALMDSQATEYVMVPADKIDEFIEKVVEPIIGPMDGVEVTNIIVAALRGDIVFGLELDGCLTGPIAIPGLSAVPEFEPLNSTMSGKLPDGRTAA